MGDISATVEAIKEVIAMAQANVRDADRGATGREMALTATKLQEALFWAQEALRVKSE